MNLAIVMVASSKVAALGLQRIARCLQELRTLTPKSIAWIVNLAIVMVASSKVAGAGAGAGTPAPALGLQRISHCLQEMMTLTPKSINRL